MPVQRVRTTPAANQSAAVVADHRTSTTLDHQTRAPFTLCELLTSAAAAANALTLSIRSRAWPRRPLLVRCSNRKTACTATCSHNGTWQRPPQRVSRRHWLKIAHAPCCPRVTVCPNMPALRPSAAPTRELKRKGSHDESTTVHCKSFHTSVRRNAMSTQLAILACHSGQWQRSASRCPLRQRMPLHECAHRRRDPCVHALQNNRTRPFASRLQQWRCCVVLTHSQPFWLVMEHFNCSTSCTSC
jgi:hypothetical protein